jgi:hypothetical protein
MLVMITWIVWAGFMAAKEGSVKTKKNICLCTFSKLLKFTIA